MLLGILGHIGDDDEARSIVKRLLDGLASGSYLALYDQSGAIPYRLRSPEQVAGLFAGLELVEPGVVSLPRWRPDPTEGDGPPREIDAVGGVGRKP
jgi:hypothetical protein